MAGFELSQYQRDIINFFTTYKSKNILIEALAGCAKTTTLLELSKLSTTSDVYVAFNKSIQTEVSNKNTNPKMKCYTIHALCYQVMRWNLEQSGKTAVLNSNKIFELYRPIYEQRYSHLKQQSFKRFFEYFAYLKDNYGTLYNLIRLKYIDLHDSNEDRLRRNIEYIINELGLFASDGVNSAPDIECIIDDLIDIDNVSCQQFTNSCICDFTDMLYITLQKLQTQEWQIPYWLLYTNIYVDECQDVSPIQFQLLRYFKRKYGRFIFVGDPNQAIYAFSGGDIDAWNSIQKIFSPIQIFRLPQNYRCDKTILDATAKKFNINIVPGPQAQQGTVTHIDYQTCLNQIHAGDFLVSRYNKDLLQAACDLLDSDHKIFLSDTEFIQKMIHFIQGRKYSDFNELSSDVSRLSKRHEKQQQALFAQMMQTWQNTEPGDQSITTFVPKDDAADPLDFNVGEMASSINILLHRFKQCSRDTTIEAFETWINTKLTTVYSKDCVVLITIHKVKGLEADNVYLLREGEPQYNLGKSAAMRQQEVNLSYVAYTRAKHNLYLVNNISDEGDCDETDSDEYEYY